MKISYLLLTALVLVPSLGVAREWSDSTGAHRVEAALLRVEGDRVLLVRPDGQKTSIQRTALSTSDQRRVAAFEQAMAKPRVTPVSFQDDRYQSNQDSSGGRRFGDSFDRPGDPLRTNDNFGVDPTSPLSDPLRDNDPLRSNDPLGGVDPTRPTDPPASGAPTRDADAGSTPGGQSAGDGTSGSDPLRFDPLPNGRDSTADKIPPVAPVPQPRSTPSRRQSSAASRAGERTIYQSRSVTLHVLGDRGTLRYLSFGRNLLSAVKETEGPNGDVYRYFEPEGTERYISRWAVSRRPGFCGMAMVWTEDRDGWRLRGWAVMKRAY